MTLNNFSHSGMLLVSNYLPIQLFFFCVFPCWCVVPSNLFNTFYIVTLGPVNLSLQFTVAHSKHMNTHISRERTNALCAHANLNYRAFYIGCRNQGRDNTCSGIILFHCFLLFFVNGDVTLFFLHRCRRCMYHIPVFLFLCRHYRTLMFLYVCFLYPLKLFPIKKITIKMLSTTEINQLSKN
jgi:hypothetical protein